MSKAKNKKLIFSSFFCPYLFVGSICAGYFVILVLPSKLIVVSLMFFLVVTEKLFSHGNHASLLIRNFVHQLVRIFCGHPMKVNLNKRLIHLVAISKPNNMFLVEVGFVSIGVKGFLPFPLGLILELFQKSISLIESCPL